MSAFKSYAEAVTRICNAADFVLSGDPEERVRDRVRNSLAFYQAAASTCDAGMRAASFEAALRELRAAAEHLNRHAGKYVKGWKPITL